MMEGTLRRLAIRLAWLVLCLHRVDQSRLLFKDPWKCFPISGLWRIETGEWAGGGGLTICADNNRKCPCGVARGPRGGSELLGLFSWEQG